MLWNIWFGMVLTGVILFVVSLILIFVLKIPDLLDELSGRKAKRQIKRLKELNIGTGALGEVATDDVYLALPSGSLLSEEVTEVPKREIVEKKDSVVVDYDENDIPTSDMSEQEETGFMDTDSETTLVDDNDITGILNDISEYCKNRKVIKIVEEQSSL